MTARVNSNRLAKIVRWDCSTTRAGRKTLACAKDLGDARAAVAKLSGVGALVETTVAEWSSRAIPGTVTWLEYPSSPISFDAPATPAS